jgi:PAS domain S-box-containing protein
MLSDHLASVAKISRLLWGLIAAVWLVIGMASALALFGVPVALRAVFDGSREAAVVALIAGMLITWLMSLCWMEYRNLRLKSAIDVLNQLLENAPVGIQLKDADLRYVWFNKAHTANHGNWHVQIQDLIGKTVLEAGFTPELARKIMDHDLATLQAASPLEPQEQVREASDGSAALVALVTKVPIIQNGAVRYIATMAADTSAWREAQIRTEDSRRLLETVMDAAPITIQVIDRDMRFRWVNRCYRDYFDIGEAPVLGRHLTEIDRSRHMISEVVATNERILNGTVASLRMEQHLPARNGRPEVYLSVTKVPVKDSHGNIVQVLTMGTDITELKRTQGRADLATGLVEAILRHAPIALQVKDTDLRFQWANQHFADTLGVAAEHMIGRRLVDFGLPADAFALTDERDRLVLATGKSIEFDERWIKDGRHKYFRVIKAALVGKDGRPTHVITSGADITEHARLRAEAESARNLLQMVVENVPVALALKDVDQRFLLANAAFGRFWSVSPGAIIGRIANDRTLAARGRG